MLFKIIMACCDAVIPLVMLLFGVRFLKNPPEQINPRTGYRSARSVKSQDAWDFAQKYCGRVWRTGGIILTVITAAVLTMSFLMDDKDAAVTIAALCMTQLAAMLLSVYLIEAALKREFDESGEKKS